MTQRASDSLVAVLIRIGLLLALAVLLMAENAQAQPLTTSSWSSSRSSSWSRQIRTDRPTRRPRPVAATRTDSKW